MFSETATELVRGSDFTGFYIAITIIVLVYLFVYFKNAFQKS